MPDRGFYGEFLHVETSGADILWKRLSLGDTAGRNEAWLRDLLQEKPQLIPIAEIDPSFGPLIPVCTELHTPAGFIDNVFIDQHGRLTLVECKLWKNHESRRKAVAQILDYAKELGKWSYSDLQREVSARTGIPGNFLFERVKRHCPELLEHQFIDAVTRGLRGGRFLLLLAGDGIREDVQVLGSLLNRNAASGFSFGMFEVALYATADRQQILVQPRPLVRTQILERIVVVRQDGTLADGEDAEQGAASPQAIAAHGIHKDSAAWWDSVLASKLDDPEQLAFQYRWPHHIRGALPWPGTWIMAFRSGGPKATMGVYVRGREIPLAELLRALAPLVDEILRELPEGAEFDLDEKTFGVQRRWDEFTSDDERRKWLGETVNSFVNALRWRVGQLRQASAD